ncbi:hypothetical protein [uncultured Thiohalocapsa sp.]|uniref:dual OB domain-containing protein n=1 Tax=uncultured Thiohalocapsa sp. TaxID=768990 RepID=UPI0025E38537|nr:hypothetical protein [uncultured Thiohalocapsa sp.]
MAAYSTTLVVLANSCKHNGRCVAGKAITNRRFGRWIRPTSAHRSGALYADDLPVLGGPLAPLDVVEVPLSHQAPAGFQAENYRIAPGKLWVKRGRLSTAALNRAVDPAGALWLDGYSSGGGDNDRVPEQRLGEADGSLRLIGPLPLHLQVVGGRVRARFEHAGRIYNLSVTDPWVKAAYTGRLDGWYGFGEAFLCLSLAPVFNGFAYKLAAAIIPVNAG